MNRMHILITCHNLSREEKDTSGWTRKENVQEEGEWTRRRNEKEVLRRRVYPLPREDDKKDEIKTRKEKREREGEDRSRTTRKEETRTVPEGTGSEQSVILT